MPEEKENLNDFKRWDAVGATGFIALVPVVLCYVFTEHSITACIPFLAVAAVATLAVLLLTFLFPEVIVGRIVNFAGVVLAPVYLLVAVGLFWAKWSGDDAPVSNPDAQQQNAPAADASPAQQPAQ